MDLTVLKAPNHVKEALKRTLQLATDGLSGPDKFDLLAGAMFGLEEVQSGEISEDPRTRLTLMGPEFFRGRDLVVKFPLFTTPR